MPLAQCAESGDNGVGAGVSLSTIDFYTGVTYTNLSPYNPGADNPVWTVKTGVTGGVYCNGTRIAINEIEPWVWNAGKGTATFRWTMNGNYWVYFGSGNGEGSFEDYIANGGYKYAVQVRKGTQCSATLYFDSTKATGDSSIVRRQVVNCGRTWDSSSGGKYYPATALAFIKNNPTVSPSTQSTLRYDSNGGSGSMSSQTAPTGSWVTVSSNRFTKTSSGGDCTFRYWSTSPSGGTRYDPYDEISLDRDMTLYAQWSCPVKKYTLSYDPNGGNGSMSSQTAEEGSDVTVNENGFTHDGYTFQGWATSPTGSIAYHPKDSITLNSDMTLYAQWKPITVQITYDPNQGEGSHDPTKGEANSDITIPSDVNDPFHRDHYELTGWNTKPDGSGDPYQPGDTIHVGVTDQILYAQWKRVPVKVNYDPNGGQGSHDPTPGDAGEDITIPSDLNDPFTKPGGILIGWNTEPDGSGDSYEPGDSIHMEDEDKTLYAQWKDLPSVLPSTGGDGLNLMLPTILGVAGVLFAIGLLLVVRRRMHD